LYKQTSELAIHDSLTKLFVQQHFKNRLKEEQERALLAKDPLSLLMCDIDFFKKYNDRYGHAAGDLILVQIADIIRQEVHDTAIAARYGGEEFSIILPKTTLAEARAIAEQIRKKTEEHPFMLRQESTSITVSVGVSNLPIDTSDDEELIRVADQRLYEAKKLGRNKVC
jgi:diguanylate cyclase (GGDEF)-like protein